MLAANCRSIAYQRMPPLVGNPHRPGESLLCASACLDLLLYHD
jgi:hypothetical protein